MFLIEPPVFLFPSLFLFIVLTVGSKCWETNCFFEQKWCRVDLLNNNFLEVSLSIQRHYWFRCWYCELHENTNWFPPQMWLLGHFYFYFPDEETTLDYFTFVSFLPISFVVLECFSFFFFASSVLFFLSLYPINLTLGYWKQ